MRKNFEKSGLTHKQEEDCFFEKKKRKSVYACLLFHSLSLSLSLILFVQEVLFVFVFL